MEFWFYFYKHLDSDLFLQTLEFSSYILRLQTMLEFWPSTLEFWLLSVQSLKFYDYNRSTANIVILVLSLYTLEFLSYPSKHWNSYLILSLQTWKFCSHPSKHWNSGPIFINMIVVIFSFQTLEFWPYFYTFWLSDLILKNFEILFL